jgi:putative phosphonate catabolism associated alcohol dehydrogenase
VTARAAIFDQAGKPFRVAEMPLPSQLGSGETLVQIALATICGSDLHTVAGRRNEPTPCVLGHEAVGRVVAAGRGREDWLGKRVTWTSADSCGVCAACTELDLPQKCERLFKYGHSSISDGTGLNGAYATHIHLRHGTHLVEVADHLADATVAPANCSLATMAAATEHLPRPCRLAVVQGAGLLGLHGCALLRAAGVARVIVVDPDPERQGNVAAFGGELATSEEVESGSADVVIEAAGVAGVVPEGLRMLRVGGHYRLVGMVHPQSALNLTGEAIIRGCVTLRGIHNYAPRHLDRAVAFLRELGDLPWASLVSPPLPLGRMNEAVALATSRRWARVSLATNS